MVDDSFQQELLKLIEAEEAIENLKIVPKESPGEVKVVSHISEPIRNDLGLWFDKRVHEWEMLGKLHYSLLGLKKTEYEASWKPMIQDMKGFYEELKTEFVTGQGLIQCLPRETKSDIVPFLRRKAETYDDPRLCEEAKALAEVIYHKVPACSPAGLPSRTWLRNRGYSKEDLKTVGNITQVVKPL